MLKVKSTLCFKVAACSSLVLPSNMDDSSDEDEGKLKTGEYRYDPDLFDEEGLEDRLLRSVIGSHVGRCATQSYNQIQTHLMPIKLVNPGDKSGDAQAFADHYQTWKRTLHSHKISNGESKVSKTNLTY